MKKRIKIIQECWVEEDKEPFTNVPVKCPVCNSKMIRTNALKLINLLFVWCSNSECRYALEFEL